MGLVNIYILCCFIKFLDRKQYNYFTYYNIFYGVHMARPVSTELSKLIVEKFNMTIKAYAQDRGLSYNSLKLYVSGLYTANRIVKAQLIKDGILTDGRPE